LSKVFIRKQPLLLLATLGALKRMGGRHIGIEIGVEALHIAIQDNQSQRGGG
jgi:hypothetical protein